MSRKNPAYSRKLLIVISILIIIAALYFIPIRRSLRLTLDAIEYHMSHDIYESATLDIKGAYLSYLLKNDAVHYEFYITSQNDDGIECYDYAGSVSAVDGMTYSSFPQYSSKLDRYIPFTVTIRYEPFCIAIRYNDRYLFAPASNVVEAMKLKEFFGQFLFP